MKHLLVLLGAILAVAISASQAEARVKRSCDARMFVVVIGTEPYYARERTLERFGATASCPLNPEVCRERAKQKAVACMDASWKKRWNRRTPDECQSNKGISGYSMPNIKCDIYDRMCAVLRELPSRNQLGEVKAVVNGEVSGQTGACSVSNREFGEYVVESCVSDQVRAEHCG